MGGGVAKAGKAVGVGLGLVAGGVVAVTSKISENTDRIDKMSQNLGFSAESFQEWEFVLSQSGASIDSLQNGMATLSKQVTDGAEGSKVASDAFLKLGLDVTSLGEMSQEEIFEATIGSLQQMEAGAERTALANQLLGKSGKEMGALLNSSAEDISGMKDQAHELGAVLSEDAVAAGVNMTDAIDQMKRSLIGTLTEAFAPMIPMVMELIDTFVEILPPLMEFIKPLIEKLVPVITKIIDALLPPFLRLLDALMPILMPLIDIFIMLLDTALLPIIEALLPLIEVLLPPLTDLLIALSPLLTGVANIIAKTLVVAVDGLTAAFSWLLDKLQPVFDMLTVIGQKAGEVFGSIGDKIGDFGGGVGDFFSGIELPSFAVGSPYIPRDMVAQIHQGERILTAEENAAFSSGGMGGVTVNINASNIVGQRAGEELGRILTNHLSNNRGVFA